LATCEGGLFASGFRSVGRIVGVHDVVERGAVDGGGGREGLVGLVAVQSRVAVVLGAAPAQPTAALGGALAGSLERAMLGQVKIAVLRRAMDDAGAQVARPPPHFA